ncbi:pyridoxal-dependent decarboxylase [Burkholderia ubonensis]|uniref:pyridoxal-dependent decarboxylase n=1 Tax=Burkholderia ubonensis TaxID=101571 RepID=UPI00075F3619|nr:pyridoxal-dependent decarboxylase [Burkholderia ubonensis]KWB82940.1 hypothetical protein WL42_07285 [Burkholderia ubonensis]
MSNEQNLQATPAMPNQHYYTGIQVNLSPLAVSEQESARLAFLTNNLGDCYEPELCPLPNTMTQEREAVEAVAGWLDLPAGDCWGYIGGGSTLGNLQGMWMGAALMRDATLVFSKAAHYSVYKFASALNFRRVKIIDALPTGEIDPHDLERQVEHGEAIVLVLTAGTTMTSAYDAVGSCVEVLSVNECPFYLHLDAALGGFVVPFLSEEQLPNKYDYTFRHPAISSMTISTHKVLGTPMPANIFIARQSVVDRFKTVVNGVPYLGDLRDITVYGSRDGFRATVVYNRLKGINHDIVRNWVVTGVSQAHQVAQALRERGVDGAFAVPGGLATVIPLHSFERTFDVQHRQYLIDKYHLVQDARVIHMYMMSHVTPAICDEFMSDCQNPLYADA